MNDVQLVVESGYDMLVDIFARFAQENEFEMSITVTVEGAVVSGIITSRDKWLELFTEGVSSTSESGKQFSDILQELYREIDLNQTVEDNKQPYAILHLRDARYLGIGPMREGVLWRGMISRISSWSLGQLSQ